MNSITILGPEFVTYGYERLNAIIQVTTLVRLKRLVKKREEG